jgi:hypothetical protein
MDSRPLFIISLLAVYVIVVAALIAITAKSPIQKDKKIVIYLVSIFGGPLFGLIVFLILRGSNRNATA